MNTDTYKAVNTNVYCKHCRYIVAYEHNQYEKWNGELGLMCPTMETTEKQRVFCERNGFVAPKLARDASEIIERITKDTKK